MATPPDDPRRVAAVVLAAGTSSRLGRPKQLLDLAGEPVIAHVMRRVSASSADPVILVLGHRPDEIAEAAGASPRLTVVNPDYASGQASSFRAGLQSVPADAEAVVVLLGDQPTVPAGAIDRLITRYREGMVPIVQSSYRGSPGHPVLFDRSCFAALLDIQGDKGARDLLRERRGEIEFVEMDSEAPPDLDTEEDYKALLSAITNVQAK